MGTKLIFRCVGAVAIGAVATGIAACSRPGDSAATWRPKAAAAYLDQRLDWWTQWPTAARDHGTFCISCHTAVPYGLARASLDKHLGEIAPSEQERRLLDNVVKRVRLWRQTRPFYTDKAHGTSKSAQSRGTEAVLNALMLARNTSVGSRLSADAQAAFDNMWELQEQTGAQAGAWQWLDFGLAPWEFADAQYYGASLAALAVGSAGVYQDSPDIQSRLDLLRGYLRRERPRQSVHNLAVLLWASTKLRGLLRPQEQRTIVGEVFLKQNPDGGWSLNTLEPLPQKGGTMLSPRSDGYASGLVALVLQEAGVSSSDVRLQQGLAWLRRHQRPGGFWSAVSLNKVRDPNTNVGRFMNDAATAYAVLALDEASATPVAAGNVESPGPAR